MQFYANENMEWPVIEAIRALGHDVALAAEDGMGREDDQVLHTAVALKRIILTHDKDYGTLVFRDAARGVPGVLLIRLSSRSVDELAAAVSLRLSQISDRLDGNFVVISDQGTRITRLPESG